MNTFKINPDEIQLLKTQLEKEHGDDLIIPAQLRELHPLLKDVKTKLDESAKSYSSKLVGANFNQVDIIVSPKNITKALRFVNSFLKFAEKRGHRIVVQYKKTSVNIQGQEIQFKFRERTSRSDTPDKYGFRDLIPTGILYFKIESYTWSKEFSSEKQPLEDQLSTIMAYLETKGKLMHEERQQWRVAQEQEERKRHLVREAKQKIEDELNKFKTLHAQALRWKDATVIREFVLEIQNGLTNAEDKSEEKSNWIAWAKQKADWYDPILRTHDEILKDVDPEKIFGKP